MRHGFSVRLVHWTIVLEALFLLMSGFMLNGVLPIGNPANLYSYHIIVGFAFIGTAFVFFYVVVAAHDYKWFALRRIPYSFKYIFSETAYWFRLRPRIEEPIKFDAARDEYVEKLIPSVIVVWWAYALMGIILALTGLSDAFPVTFGFVYTILNPIGLALTGVEGLPFILAVHRLVAVLLVCTVALHFYASFVYRLVGSIIHGYRYEPAVGGVAPRGPAVGKIPGVQPSKVAASKDSDR